MDFIKKSYDRAKQGISENFGDAERTEFSPEFQALLNKADDVKLYTEKLLACVETLAQPDPAARLLPGFTQDGLNAHESMAETMGAFAKAIAVWVPPAPELSAVMKSGDDAFTKMGKAEKEYLAKVNSDVLVPMRRFLNEDMKTLDAERRTLNTRRLDMDSAKNKMAKSPDDKKVEDELTKAQQMFNEQKDKVQALIESMQTQHGAVQTHMKTFVGLHLQLLNTRVNAIEEYEKRL